MQSVMKIEHYFLCLWAGLIIGFIWKQNGVKAAIILALGKEVYDNFGPSGFSLLDFLFCFLGSIFKEIAIRFEI